MKNFLIKILSLCIIISTALFIGTGCEHKHTYTHYVSNNDATYDADGTKTAICDKEGCDETDIIIDKGSKLLGKGIEYELNADKKSYCVKDIGTCTDIEINIPSTYNDKPVTSIGDSAFYGCSSLKNIIIPNSVTSIGNNAFYDCSSLTSIVIPNSVTSIEDYTFSGCSNLISITIGNGVTSIGVFAFGGCDRLTSVKIPNSVAKIGISAFFHCDSLTSVTIGNGVTSIEDYTFSGCSNLISVTIPNSVTSIGADAFSGCSNLISITIGNGVTSIGFHAFYGCSNLIGVTFSDASTWYRTTSIEDWKNKTGGAQTSVTNSYTNATYFKSPYTDHCWYKL